jgi:hypothetical protein
VLLDESSYAARFGGAVAPPGRLEERRRLWREFVAGYGVEVSFTGESDGPAAG